MTTLPCGPQTWHSCQGSQPHTRGYTCGLWQLFHSLAVGVPDTNGGLLWMEGVRGFVKHYFQCTACAEHFGAMTGQDSALRVATRRDAVMWAWRAHNRVSGGWWVVVGMVG